MALTSKQKRLAEKIDRWVKGIERRGGGEKEMLEGMYAYMSSFKQLLDTCTSAEMDMLATKYQGFFRFASLLENLARGIASGDIVVPE